MIVEVLVIGGAVGATAFALIRSYYSSASRHLRALRRKEIWPIGELPDGTVGRMIGTVRAAGATLKAPVTGRACVCYHLTVSTNTEDAHTIISDQQGVPFVLEDDSGRALVDPEGAALERYRAHDDDASTTRGATKQQLDLLEAYGQKDLGLEVPLRFREEIVEIGEDICVAGAGVRDADPDAVPAEGYRTAPATRLRIASSPRFQILITDAPFEAARRKR